MDAKLYVPIVTLSTKDNVNLTKQLTDGFKRSVYWKRYPTIPVTSNRERKKLSEFFSASFQGAKRLFVLAYFVDTGANTDEEAGIKDNNKYFLLRGEINNYIILIDEINFHDQPINDLIKQYNEVRKVQTGKGDGYTTGCLLGYVYFKNNYRLLAVDLSKQKALHADSRANQQIAFQGVVRGTDGTKIRMCTILEKSKETVLEFYKGTAKVL